MEEEKKFVPTKINCLPWNIDRIGYLEKKIPLLKEVILRNIEKGAILKIYLFGSFAYGVPHRRSDLDVCIITDDRYAEREKEDEIYMQVSENLSNDDIVPVDILIFNKLYFDSITIKGKIHTKIREEGKLLYEY